MSREFLYVRVRVRCAMYAGYLAHLGDMIGGYLAWLVVMWWLDW